MPPLPLELRDDMKEVRPRALTRRDVGAQLAVRLARQAAPPSNWQSMTSSSAWSGLPRFKALQLASQNTIARVKPPTTWQES